MFMFTFSVITISVVGLFFQIVTTLTSYLLSVQMGLGQQLLAWHSMAFAYACTAAGLAEPDGGTVTISEVSRASQLTGSYQWNTTFFTGTYAGATRRMIVTYVTPTEKPLGFSSYDVARQLTRVTIKQNFSYGRSTAAQTATFSTYDGNVPSTITIGGLPAAVVTNSVVLVSDATCN